MRSRDEIITLILTYVMLLYSFPTKYPHTLHLTQINTILLRGCKSRRLSPPETFWFVVELCFQLLQLGIRKKKKHAPQIFFKCLEFKLL